MTPRKEPKRGVAREQEEEGRLKKKAKQPVYDQLKALDDGIFENTNSAYRDPLLAGHNSDEGQASLVTQLQQSLGNTHMQRLVQQIQSQKGKGQPLPPPVSFKMGAAFKHDFSNVRLHSDAAAAELSAELGARAFTSGEDIFLSKNGLQPGLASGERLIAHELTHVVQQEQTAQLSPTKITQPTEIAEIEADEAAKRLVEGRDVSVAARSELSGAIAREGNGNDKGKNIKISLSIPGIGDWKDIGFSETVTMIRNHTEVERKSCENFVNNVNQDQWIVSFWSELLGGVKPPKYEMWIKPIYALGSATEAMRAGKVEAAKTHLENAVEAYNAVHKAWLDYREGVSKGAGRAVTAMKVTITVLGAAATGGVGSWMPSTLSAGTKLLAEAGVSAGVELVKETATAGGEYAYGLEQKVDVSRMVKNVGTAFVSSLLGGALSKGFLSLLTPKIVKVSSVGTVLPAEYTLRQQLVTNFLGGVGSKLLEQAINRAVDKFQGKQITMMELLEEIANQLLDLGATAVFTASLEAVKK